FDIVGFDYITDGTIERIDTLIEGESRPRRKRVNLEGSTVPGFEISTFITQLNPLSIEASLAWMQPRATAPNAVDSTDFLAERPEMIAFVALDYNFDFGLQPTIEVSHTKPGYSLGDGGFVELPSYTVLNARLAYRFFFSGMSAQVFMRANNLTDANPMNQLGLPGAGREIHGGVKVLF
ncbi:MAG TPA: TonB-dependent receptor, partial [Blastocatellia bacterium]|nr:TonB-dependent receptor [Blastocatellia bacterium]